MKTKLSSFLIVLALLSGSNYGAAQSTSFFRISGPAATTITGIRADGSLVWSNALAGTNYTVQMATSLVGGANWVDYVQLPVTDAVNVNRIIDPNPPAGMALIPAGSFTMGNCMDPNEGNADELPLHPVYVSAFYMDKYDVTYALWQTVYNWAITNGYSFDHAGSGKAANHPVQTIDWFDSVKWCNARSEMEGRTPAYYTDPAQTMVYRSGHAVANSQEGSIWVIWNGGYRLPTEAEWEKAARGGLIGKRFPWGNTISWSQALYHAYPLSLAPYGYAYDLATAFGSDPAFDGGGYPYTSPVGYFAPNGYGLYDMAGNVWQWCWGWYWSYGSAAQTDPHGLTSGSTVVCRGGDHEDNAPFCRTAHREQASLSYADAYLGFRTVLPLGQ
jgi:formylglycine-generating enzyme required for sulfatase activity